MATIDQTPSSSFNKLKWIFVALIVIGSVVGNIYFGSDSLSIRAAVLIIVAIVGLLIAKSTAQGALAWTFLKDARTELRKVVWPTRQETIQTTALVIGVVIILSLILWGVDSLFALLISGIIG